MAYLRAYMTGMGDPGFGSWLKKRLKITPKSFTPGNILGGVATAASFLPLPGAGVLGKLGAKAATMLPRAAQIAKILGPVAAGGAISGITGGIAGRMMGPQLPSFGPGIGPPLTDSDFARTGAQLPGRRHRRMNVTNVRALRRAIRRVSGFKHLATQTITLTKAVHVKKRGRRR